MVDVRPFARRSAPPAAPVVDVTFASGARTRRFSIRPAVQPGEWFCQVWIGESQHRGIATADVQRVKAEYFREMDELERDGWTIAAGHDPRPTTEI